MLSHELEVSLNLAVNEATRRGHRYVTVEHILYALLYDRSARTAIEACGGSIEHLREDLENFFDDHLKGEPLEKGHLPQPTVGFQRVIQRAAQHVQASGKEKIYGENILVSIFSETDSFAIYYLQKQEISRLDLLQYISHGVTKNGKEEEQKRFLPGKPRQEPDEEDLEGDRLDKKDPLALYAVDLCERARKGQIDPLIGRELELERTMQVLCRRRKNNPLFVGDAGVGKTAIAEGLAVRVVKGEVPEALKEAKIYSLDLGGMLAGSKFRGDFEQRLKGVLASLKRIEKSILFIDEIHTLIGAGAVGGGAMDASNLLKPALGSGELRCMGSTTFKEYRNHFENDHALARRFQKIDVEEPDQETAVKILAGLKSHYEDFHNVTYLPSSLKSAVELSSRYLSGRKLPDKAIDVIDEAAAAETLKAKKGQKKKKTITPDMIQATVAKMARIPAQKITSTDKEALHNLADKLKAAVFGQDEAIEALATSIKLARSGLGEEDRPIGSFLFAGPTGVGKTEVAKQLAKVLSIELVRFDMSEYMERHSVSRLIGAPPGYVGFDQGGLLTDAVTKSPHAVLLLDEIEKAHPDMQNILLQIMDYGSLTDNNGRKADFRNVILIMTTNAGAKELSQKTIGFTRKKGDDKGVSKAVKDMFAPEFRNRLSAIINFGALDLEVVKLVARKFVDEVATKLRRKKVDLKISNEAVEWLAKTGYDDSYGARPIKRLVEDKIKQPLADELLFGKLAKGGHVKIDLENGKLAFHFS